MATAAGHECYFSYINKLCCLHSQLIHINSNNPTPQKLAAMDGYRFIDYPKHDTGRYICRAVEVPHLKGTKAYHDIPDLLGDHLIDHQLNKISTKVLVGKYLVLLIDESPDNFEPGPGMCVPYRDLKHSYDAFKKDTEVVFVPDGDIYSEDYREFFSTTPWLCVPSEDGDIKEKLIQKFGRRWIILDPEGYVLQTWGEFIFHYYGEESYPFTDAKINEIKSQDAALVKGGPSFNLNALLASDGRRDFLLSSPGDGTKNFTKVQISKLKGKLIGLLFIDLCKSWCTFHMLVERLIEVYSQLKGTEKDIYDFQIVFVPLPIDCTCLAGAEELFNTTFGRMPWLALPYGDPTCRKLWRIFGLLDKFQSDDQVITVDRVLVILGPDGKLLEDRLGASNMRTYGPDGYPFTQQRAAEIEVNRLKSLTLESYFSRAGIDIFKNKHGEEVHVSKLSGKQVIVIFAASYCFEFSAFLRKLKDLYARNRGTADEFEVIHLAFECSESSYNECVASMPWWLLPFDRDALLELTEMMFEGIPDALPGLAAFGEGGKFLTKQRFLMDHVKMEEGVFPFVKDNEDLVVQIMKDFPKRSTDEAAAMRLWDYCLV